MLPFTHDDFLDVFASYNVVLWPATLLLWLTTAAAVVRWAGSRRVSAAAVLWLLAAHWAWSAVAYHWSFFRAINPAAAAFAAMFVGQAVMLAALALSGARPRAASGWRFGAGVALAIYGLAYPLLGLALGLQYPRMPVFGVPCPTTLVTAGLLVGAVEVPRWSLIGPILWCVIGGSAAFVLGMHADLVLVVAGVLMVAELLSPHGRWPR